MMNTKKVLISVILLSASSMSFASNENSPQNYTPELKNNIENYILSYQYDKDPSLSYKNHMLNAPNESFNGSCEDLVKSTNESANKAITAVLALKSDKNIQLSYSGSTIASGILASALIGASAATRATSLAVNLYGQCNQKSSDALKYLGNILDYGSMTLSLIPH